MQPDRGFIIVLLTLHSTELMRLTMRPWNGKQLLQEVLRRANVQKLIFMGDNVAFWDSNIGESNNDPAKPLKKLSRLFHPHSK